jgi:hypothetical protein
MVHDFRTFHSPRFKPWAIVQTHTTEWFQPFFSRYKEPQPKTAECFVMLEKGKKNSKLFPIKSRRLIYEINVEMNILVILAKQKLKKTTNEDKNQGFIGGRRGARRGNALCRDVGG